MNNMRIVFANHVEHQTGMNNFKYNCSSIYEIAQLNWDILFRIKWTFPFEINCFFCLHFKTGLFRVGNGRDESNTSSGKKKKEKKNKTKNWFSSKVNLFSWLSSLVLLRFVFSIFTCSIKVESSFHSVRIVSITSIKLSALS